MTERERFHRIRHDGERLILTDRPRKVAGLTAVHDPWRYLKVTKTVWALEPPPTPE